MKPFAQRMNHMQKSFIREILSVAQRPEVISFAGGLPNPDYFPKDTLADAAYKVLAEDGKRTLQYAPTLGHEPLRQFIADRYAAKSGLVVHPDEILITNGSQQALELVAKIVLDPGDQVILESPSYLGGIQAFSLFQPKFVTVPLLADGVDTAVLNQHAAHPQSKLYYALPNFQNPTGITYSEAKRQQVAQILHKHDIFLLEDDPYGDLRFMGENLPTITSYGRNNAFLLGSFSKTVAPGMRMGWICATDPLMQKLIIAQQASSLHANYFSQRVLYQYLQDNDLDTHITTIKEAYRRQRELMVAMIEELFPPEIEFTLPEGGMFLWVTFPEGIDTMDLFNTAVSQNVVFVPGHPFYPDGSGSNTLRLNFSNTTEAKIEAGMTRLATAVKSHMVSI